MLKRASSRQLAGSQKGSTTNRVWVPGSSPHSPGRDSTWPESQTWGQDVARELQEQPHSSGSGRERRAVGEPGVGGRVSRLWLGR